MASGQYVATVSRELSSFFHSYLCLSLSLSLSFSHPPPLCCCYRFVMLCVSLQMVRFLCTENCAGKLHFRAIVPCIYFCNLIFNDFCSTPVSFRDCADASSLGLIHWRTLYLALKYPIYVYLLVKCLLRLKTLRKYILSDIRRE